MADETDRLPTLPDEFDEHADTIVLEDSDIMETKELRQLLDPDAEPSEEEESGDNER